MGVSHIILKDHLSQSFGTEDFNVIFFISKYAQSIYILAERKHTE